MLNSETSQLQRVRLTNSKAITLKAVLSVLTTLHPDPMTVKAAEVVEALVEDVADAVVSEVPVVEVVDAVDEEVSEAVVAVVAVEVVVGVCLHSKERRRHSKQLLKSNHLIS
jgi:hypothetical protein